MATGRLRVGAFGAVTMFAAMACSGGFGGASTAPSQAPPESAAPTAEPSASVAAEPVTLTFGAGEVEATQTTTKALADAYTALHPNVTFEFETFPSGTEGDNLVKTRLATGEMTDIFWYNSGSLLQALNPTQSLVDISGEPFVANIAESFLPTVSVGDQIFGVPGQTAMGGGILYNKKVFEENDITVPTSWAEFQANNEKLKAAGVPPVGATWGGTDTWTSQIFVLADYCNVQNAVPEFSEQYTANEAHYSDTPAARKGFDRLQEGFEKDWWQEDFGAATFDDGLNMLAAGEIAQYPMLTFALSTIQTNHPDLVEDIGFFGIPGDDAASNCATIWMPSAIYIANTSEHQDVAKDFLAFVASVEGTDAITAALAPTGPYVIKGATLPDDALPAVKDIQPYIDGGNNVPALEFLSPVKGPSLEQITVAVGSGLNTAEEGAALYDQDVEKQAKQLGLPGWE
jgi:raffinose/stachyose/melibiose transport system substrate-binding protein